MWRRLTVILLCISMVFVIVGCGNKSDSAKDNISMGSQTEEKQTDETTEKKEQSDEDTGKTGKVQTDVAPSEEQDAEQVQADSTEDASEQTRKAETPAVESQGAIQEKETEKSPSTNVLVVYFSRTGEQYGVGVIDKGNTAIIADMIAEKTGANSFEIIPETDNYAVSYQKLTEIAKEEMNQHARPAMQDTITNFSDYDTIFIGYPIWWGDLPMIVYTFLESYDFSGKQVIPFCTHAGSGMASTDNKIRNSIAAASVEKGLAVEGTVAQNNQEKARESVNSWLSGLGY